MRLIFKNIKFSFLFTLVLTLFSSIIYVAICLNTDYRAAQMETDNLDYILPFILLGFIFYNFRYLKDNNELIHLKTLPVTSNKFFNLRCLNSFISFTFIYIVYMIISIILIKDADRDLSKINFNLFYISLFLKYILSLLLFNFFLFCFTKGKKLTDGICYVVMGNAIISILIILYLFIFTYSKLTTDLVLLFAFNSFYGLTFFFKVAEISTYDKIILYAPLFFYLILGSVSIPLNFKSNKTINLETIEEVKIPKYLHQFLTILALLLLIIIPFFSKSYIQYLSILIFINGLIYLMYSIINNRFKPTKYESIVYIIIFILSIFSYQLFN